MISVQPLTGLPSGDQHVLTSGNARAVVVDVGGGVRAYEVGGRAVLDGYAEDAQAVGGAGMVLAPWPNRLRDGRYTFDGTAQQLALTEPTKGNAIHGLARWQSWTRVDQTPLDDRATLRFRVNPQPGYPWPLLLEVTWSLSDEGLRADHTATNLGSSPCPFGLGVHPYLTVPGVPADDLVLQLTAESYGVVDERGLPIGSAPVTGSDVDFSSARRVGGQVLDTSFSGLARDGDGRARVRVVSPDGTGAELWMDGAFGHAQVFSGDTLPQPRRRRSLAVEPMTCPADAFNSGTDVVRLEPGQTWQGSWGVTPLS